MLKAELMAENEALKKRVAELEAALQKVLAQLDAEKRAGKRQAAPFSRGEKKQNPQRPGRKKGHKATHRSVPRQVDQVHEARLKHACCLKCGGLLAPPRIEQQYQIDIPPVQPVVTQFNIEVAHCTCCGQRTQGRHPQQTSDALGPAAVQLGPRALALAVEMKHALGVPYRKVARILTQGFGLTTSAGALARASQRLAHQAQPTYDQLVLRLRQQDVVCTDETGWKINGDNAWLWVFTSAQLTLYTIDPRRAGEVAQRILHDFEGVLTCDCLPAYNPLPYRQQKCLAHLLRRCSDIAQQPQPASVLQLSYQVTWLLRAAITLKLQKNDLPPLLYAQDCAHLEQALDRLLDTADVPQNDTARRLLNLLRKQRHRLFTFLYYDPVQPTNNAAERAIRPAVIVRKISAGNRSSSGALAHALITSLWQTAHQQNLDFCDLVSRLLRTPKPQPFDLLAQPDTEDTLGLLT